MSDIKIVPHSRFVVQIGRLNAYALCMAGIFVSTDCWIVTIRELIDSQLLPLLVSYQTVEVVEHNTS